MNTHYILILLFSPLFFCCTNTIEDKKFSGFQDTEKLYSEPITKINFFSERNVELNVIDTFLILQRWEEDIIHIYNTNNYNLLVKFGSKGKGPNEFIDPELTNYVRYDSLNNSPLIYLYDYKRRQYTEINIFNAINNDGKIYSQISLPITNGFIQYFLFKNHDLLIYSSIDEKGWITKYNLHNNLSLDIPFSKRNFSKIAHTRYYNRLLRPEVFVNTNKNLMVAAPLRIGELHFFDLDGNLKWITDFNPEYNNSLIYDVDPDLLANIVHIKGKPDKIFGLNFNRSTEIWYSMEGIKSKIQVFNWEGQPLTEYILDDSKFLSAFAVDELNNCFYGYCPDELEHNIVKYEIPDSSSEIISMK